MHESETGRNLQVAKQARVPRTRNDPDRELDRRIVLKAAAGMTAIVASGMAVAPTERSAIAQEAGGTRATRWVASERGGGFTASSSDPWVTFEADYQFFAIGGSWAGSVGTWPVIQMQLSDNGGPWSETIELVADTDDGGQPTRDNRLFTPLAFTGGATAVRYRTVDTSGITGDVADLSFLYIDATDGPWDADITPESVFTTADTDTIVPPEIVTRAQWGANENWRFDRFGEVWPPEYRTVSHIIIHHTATANRPFDVPGAIRSIYYYHAVEQGWGDIGYNYLVDHNGRIYEGRYGGQDVIGGHSFQYAVGSSGISTIGNFQSVDVSAAAKSSLVAITAWVGRDLDPNGRQNFYEVPNLPIISSHRDVNATTCPGDRLWNDLPEIRDLVAATLDQNDLDTGLPGGIVPGDFFKVQTDDGSVLNVRTTPRGNVIDTIANGRRGVVIDGPDRRYDGNWYRISWASGTRRGWVLGKYLIVDPPLPPGSGTGDFPFGLNVRFTAETNIRSQPTTTSGIRATVPRNTWAAVLAGPMNRENRVWYQVRFSGGTVGWAIRDNIVAAPVNTNPSARFRVGDNVVTTESVNIRPRPGIAQTVISTEGAGAALRITQSAFSVTDYIWYGVYNDRIGGGWVVENYLRLSTSTPPPSGNKFALNDRVEVTETLNLRSSPTTSAGIVAVLDPGRHGIVLEGPRSANGYVWWRLQTTRGTGWAVQNWLVKVSGGSAPAGRFRVNETVRVTEALNLRSSASTSGSVIAVLPVNSTGTVLGGPRSANGYTWWQLRTSRGTGWAAENWLTSASSASASSTGFAGGSSVVVFDGALNLRAGAGTTNAVRAVLPDGHELTIVSGPQTVSGSAWYAVRSATFGTGWVIGDFIRAS